MSLKAELELWSAALEAYDRQDFLDSLQLFSVCCRLCDSLGSINVCSSVWKETQKY